jgi:hypothetical protein
MMIPTINFSQKLSVLMGQLKPKINLIIRGHLLVDIKSLTAILLK